VARVKDPDGNFVELIYPDSPTPAKLNHIAVALRMGDVERSKEFYGKTLGLKVIPPHGDPKNPSFGFAIGDSSIFVKHIPNDLPNRGGAPTDATGYRAIMLAVSDVGALEASLKGRDVKIVEPAHGEKVKTLTIADPDGVYLIFVSGS
jgi:catechol 2,3-dioxygenase-like lactoylglutathione lyase family enzyme